MGYGNRISARSIPRQQLGSETKSVLSPTRARIRICLCIICGHAVDGKIVPSTPRNSRWRLRSGCSVPNVTAIEGLAVHGCRVEHGRITDSRRMCEAIERAGNPHLMSSKLDQRGHLDQNLRFWISPYVTNTYPAKIERAQKTYVHLVVRSEAISGRESTRKLISEIKIRLLVPFEVFLSGETVGFCTDAPAGPISVVLKRPTTQSDSMCPARSPG